MEKSPKIEITELFMAKAGKKGWDRCFHGTIKRETNSDGNTIVYGKIKVHDGYIYAKASDQWELGDLLDDMVLIVLDKGLHSGKGIVVKIFDLDFNLN
ncbi:MAG: hypothetical protein H6539_00080 [Bacteroidales bacterium]|nr:hypothetical protein [Bacteroidales bacterium]